MTALRDLQSGFRRSVLLGDDADVADLVRTDGIAAVDRLRIYRNTARSVMIAALRLSFPVIDRLVGETFFDMAAARFARDQPPSTGCLADFGAAFPDFLDALPEAAGLPYLADVARLEWALSGAATAPDADRLDARALQSVPVARTAHIGFVPHPSVSLLRLAFPADDIVDAVLSDDEAAMQEIDLGSGPADLLVERGPGGIRTARVDAAEREFVAALLAGRPFGVLMDGSADSAVLLARQFNAGRIIGLRETEQ